MKVEFKNNSVVVTIPCGDQDMKNAPASKSGKTKMVASTGGFVQVDGAPKGVKLSLNLTAPKE